MRALEVSLSIGTGGLMYGQRWLDLQVFRCLFRNDWYAIMDEARRQFQRMMSMNNVIERLINQIPPISYDKSLSGY